MWQHIWWLTLEMGKQGSFPMLAPVKPYTELALIFRASCRPSNTYMNKVVSLNILTGNKNIKKSYRTYSKSIGSEVPLNCSLPAWCLPHPPYWQWMRFVLNPSNPSSHFFCSWELWSKETNFTFLPSDTERNTCLYDLQHTHRRSTTSSTKSQN